jgi:hypothetical protein
LPSPSTMHSLWRKGQRNGRIKEGRRARCSTGQQALGAPVLSFPVGPYRFHRAAAASLCCGLCARQQHKYCCSSAPAGGHSFPSTSARQEMLRARNIGWGEGGRATGEALCPVRVSAVSMQKEMDTTQVAGQHLYTRHTPFCIEQR